MDINKLIEIEAEKFTKYNCEELTFEEHIERAYKAGATYVLEYYSNIACENCKHISLDNVFCTVLCQACEPTFHCSFFEEKVEA